MSPTLPLLPDPWLLGLAGGALIGLAAVVLMAFHGKILGVSGILSYTVSRTPTSWRVAFVLGLLLGALGVGMVLPQHFGPPLLQGWGAPLAGLLVGLGSALGSGCTSGHGVCGLARLSKRSMVAVAVFMGVALLTVWGVRHGL